MRRRPKTGVSYSGLWAPCTGSVAGGIRAGLLSWRRNRHARNHTGPTLIPPATQATLVIS